MKVLVITAIYPTPDNPGFGSYVHSQVEFLRRSGLDIDVLVLKGRNRKLIYPRGIFQLRHRLEGVSLVHAHYAYVGAIARTQWRVPVVLTYHGDDAQGTVTAKGTISPFSRVVATGCRNLARVCDAVIVQSSRMAGLFRYGNVHIIPHEVDFETFCLTDLVDARRQLGLRLDTRYFLFAANPDIPVKRFALARQAFEQVRRRHGNAELIITSHEPQTRLALYMNACDALIFPSYQEGSPCIVKQAMACNLPIVATDVGDVREVIGDTAGCTISEPTPEAFAAALCAIATQPFRTNGREAVRRLSGPLVAERVIRVYEQVLRAKPASL